MEKRGKELLHYIVPSAGALCVTYLYNIVDGIFVGRGVGHLASRVCHLLNKTK